MAAGVDVGVGVGVGVEFGVEFGVDTDMDVVEGVLVLVIEPFILLTYLQCNCNLRGNGGTTGTGNLAGSGGRAKRTREERSGIDLWA